MRGRKGGVSAQRQFDGRREPSQLPIVRERGDRLVQLGGNPSHLLAVGWLRKHAHHRQVAAEQPVGEGIDTEQRDPQPAVRASRDLHVTSMP